MTPAGFPHSDISGSQPVSGSPKLFAAYHVLHRLSLPRHPPYALNSLTIKNQIKPSNIQFSNAHEHFIRICYLNYPHMQLSKNSIGTRDLRSGTSKIFRFHQFRMPYPGSRTFGGGERVRTDDLLRARQALSQLSYTPVKRIKPVQGSGFRVQGCNPEP